MIVLFLIGCTQNIFSQEFYLGADLSGIPINRDNPDVIFIYARISDENGTTIQDSSNLVHFKIEGEVDETDASPNWKLIGENPVHAEAGIATILLKTEHFEMPLIITAASEGVQGGELKLEPGSR